MKSIINGQIKEVENVDKKWYGTDYFYEVIRIVDGKPLFLKEHFERLTNGIGIFDEKEIAKSIHALTKAVDAKISQNIYMSIHKENKDYTLFFIKSFYPPESWYTDGIWVPLIEIERVDPNSKIFRADYKQRIKEVLENKNAFEGLLVSDGTIKEGSRSNVFFIKGSVLHTPHTKNVLPGITRREVYEASEHKGITIIEDYIYIRDLSQYDGAFVTGTSLDLLPISGIEDLTFDTMNNETFKMLLKEYTALKEKDLNKDV